MKIIIFIFSKTDKITLPKTLSEVSREFIVGHHCIFLLSLGYNSCLLVLGYRYGTDLVPFTDDDMVNLKYKCDSKEFSVIGFTKSSNVKRHHYSGKDTMIVKAQKNDQVCIFVIVTM